MKPLPTIHDVNKFIGLVAAAAVAQDWNLVAASFENMHIDVADALAWQVSEFLCRNAPMEVWAEAAYHLPSKARFEAAADMLKRFNPTKPVAPPSTKSIISRLAFQLLRAGIGASDLVDRAREANAVSMHPLSESALNDLLVWIVRRHLQEVRNATGAAHAG